MLYHIEHQFEEPIKSWHWNLVEEVASHFPSLVWTKNQKLAAHFTLKYKFETDKIEELESVLENFTQSHKPAPVSVDGFDHFNNEAVFAKVGISAEVRIVFGDLMESLKKIPWMQWKQYDDANLHFHMTIAEKCGGRGGEVLEFLQGKQKNFNVQLNSISILKCINKDESGMEFWDLYKKYSLKP